MHVCHDLKKESANVAPPLPNTARVIPVLFYLAVAGCLFFVAYSLMQVNEAQKAKTSWQAKEVEEKKKLADLQSQTTSLETDLKKATAMIGWLRSAHPIQPLVATMTKSVDPALTTLNEIDLNRSADAPWQLGLMLRVNNNDAIGSNSGQAQLETTLAAIVNEYRAIPQGRQISPETVEYRALLLPQKQYE